MSGKGAVDRQPRAAAVLVADQRDGTVSGPGGQVRLEPKVMAVLSVLARYSGHVVTRQELLDAVWPNTVVTEYTLSRCIYQLRDKLRGVGPKGSQGQYNPVETLPKRGYRLLVRVEFTPPEIRVARDSLFIEIRRRYVLMVGLLLFAVAVAAGLWLL